MLKFPKERIRKTGVNAAVNLPPLLEAFKDTYRIITPYVDTAITNILEMCDIKQSEKKLKGNVRKLFPTKKFFQNSLPKRLAYRGVVQFVDFLKIFFQPPHLDSIVV